MQKLLLCWKNLACIQYRTFCSICHYGMKTAPASVRSRTLGQRNRSACKAWCKAVRSPLAKGAVGSWSCATVVVRLRCGFFHFSAAQKNAVEPGVLLRCFGEIKRGMRGVEMLHPEYKVMKDDAGPELAETLTPVYPTTEGLKQGSWRTLTEQALSRTAPRCAGRISGAVVCHAKPACRPLAGLEPQRCSVLPAPAATGCLVATTRAGSASGTATTDFRRAGRAATQHVADPKSVARSGCPRYWRRSTLYAAITRQFAVQPHRGTTAGPGRYSARFSQN